VGIGHCSTRATEWQISEHPANLSWIRSQTTPSRAYSVPCLSPNMPLLAIMRRFANLQLSQPWHHIFLVSSIVESLIQHPLSLSTSALPMVQTLLRHFLTLGQTFQQLVPGLCTTSTNTLTTYYLQISSLKLRTAPKCTLLDDSLSNLTSKTRLTRLTCTFSMVSRASSCHGKPAKHLASCRHATRNHHPRYNLTSKPCLHSLRLPLQQ